MPIVTVPSASRRTHSWLSVYLRSAGTFIVAPRKNHRLYEHFAVANERRLDDARVERLVAHDGLNRLADLNVERHARKRKGCAKRGRISAARDFAVAFARHNFLMRAQNAAGSDRDKADQLPARMRRGERRLADEIARARQVDRPREARFEWRHRLIHVLPVEIHPRFEPQRIARTEPARRNTLIVKRAPHGGRALRRHDQLEPVLAGVAGSRNE